MTTTSHSEKATGCPVHLEDVDLFTPGAQEHWFEAYPILHEEAPVLRLAGEGAAPGSDGFIISKYEDISHIVRDPELFPQYNPGDDSTAVEVFREAGMGTFQEANRSLRPDLEQHKQHRLQLTDPWVGAVGAERHRAMITDAANGLIDTFIERGRVEWVSEFGAPLPQIVIETILGFPLEDIPMLRKWEEAQVRRFVYGFSHRNLLTPEEEIDNAQTLVEFQRYIKGKITEKRAAPKQDMTSFLTQITYQGRTLSDDEITGVVYGMHIGGNETTQYALTAEAQLLAERPALFKELKADRSKVRYFVEEALRLYAPTQGLSTRLVARDTEIRGVAIPRGSLLHLRYGAGNRDAEEFECPMDLNLERLHPGRHLTFSQGPRSCPGSGLSRLEQNIAVNLWLDRFECMEISPGKNDFKHQPGIMLGLYELHLDVTKAR